MIDAKARITRLMTRNKSAMRYWSLARLRMHCHDQGLSIVGLRTRKELVNFLSLAMAVKSVSSWADENE